VASGLMHTTATLMLTSSAVSYYGWTRPELSAAAILACCWSVLVQPDLDQLDNGGYYGLFVLDKTSRLPVSNLWRLYWMPYAKVLRHRSIFSHTPVLGTLIRLVYGGWYLLPLIANEAGAVWLSLVVAADFLHWVMDWKLWGVFGIFKQ